MDVKLMEVKSPAVNYALANHISTLHLEEEAVSKIKSGEIQSNKWREHYYMKMGPLAQYK